MAQKHPFPFPPLQRIMFPINFRQTETPLPLILIKTTGAYKSFHYMKIARYNDSISLTVLNVT